MGRNIPTAAISVISTVHTVSHDGGEKKKRHALHCQVCAEWFPELLNHFPTKKRSDSAVYCVVIIPATMRGGSDTGVY